MFQTLINAFKVKEIRRKILFTLGMILVFRLGCYIPIPGIDLAVMKGEITGNGFLGLLNAISGDALANGTLFALGIGPYINASIIIQLLTVGIKPLENLSKQGEEGRKKIAQITRILTLVLAIVQATGIVLGLSRKSIIDVRVFGGGAQWLVYVVVILIMTAGSCLVMWIGERITEKGISNGISLIIFAGIISTAGTAIIATITAAATGVTASGNPTATSTQVWTLVGFLATVVIVFGLIVFVDLSERKVPVQYAKQIKGRKMYGGQNTHIPIKITASGVMPLIFSFAILQFPAMIGSLINPDQENPGAFNEFWGKWLGGSPAAEPGGKIVYGVVLSLLILFFAFFYGQIQFNPEDVSRNIQQYGGFIPGIRPGKPTTEYLKKINNRIILFGALFLAFVALIPTIIFAAIVPPGSENSLLTAFSATGLLIVVSIALEFNKSLESQLMMKHYKGFLD